MPASSPRSRRLIAVALTTLTLGAVMTPAAAAPRPPISNYPAAIEALASYEPQKTCSPTAKPGTSALASMLLNAYPGTRSLGIVRACNIGGTSEHKEGRAFDWGGLDAASASDRARVDDLMQWLFATDKYGNKYAMARRLGIQYMVWNRRIWGAYAASSGWRAYTGASPHTDHVHFSLSWAGANKTTSFWTGKVGDTAPPPPPAPKPPTPPTPPMVAPPARPATLPTGPALTDETVRFNTATAGAITTGALVKGQRYLVEVSGAYRYNRDALSLADAECSRSVRDATWTRQRSLDTRVPKADHLDVYIDGLEFTGRPDTDAGGTCDTRTHTYRGDFTADRTGRVTLKLWDPTGTADNAGTLSVRFIRYATPSTMTWSVPAAAAAGVTSPGALQADRTYLVTVSGTVNVGGGVIADAECSALGRGAWTRTRSVLPNQPRADHLDAIIGGVNRTGYTTTGSTTGCDARHVYRYVLRPAATRPVTVRVDDPTPAGNSGALTVRAELVAPETVTVDSAARNGARTARSYPAGVPLRIAAVGAYAAGGGRVADAECSRTARDARWLPVREDWRSARRVNLGDLLVAGRLHQWMPASGTGACDPGHAYRLTVALPADGPVPLVVMDNTYGDNSGRLKATVELA